ncbi:MAG: Siderophore-interacting protein [Frankiales bacterium]|nr:Siderophore-interacting protein [Frankiales bacterium]
MSSAQHIARTGQFRTRIVEVAALSPRMRRIVVRDPAIAAQTWPLACDIAVVLTGEDGREVRRRYTVRAAQGDTLQLDAVLHGHGPGSSWAGGAVVGDEVVFFGPRGVIEPPAAGRLLALTDESGLPAIAALAEAAERPVRVLAEIADPAETYPLPANAEVSWLPRNQVAAGGTEVLSAALAALHRAEPIGDGFSQAYVLVESRAAVVLREELGSLGLGRDRVYAKGYWNLNSRSGR